MLTYGTGTYTWENGRQLKQITAPTNFDVSFKYNDSGIRTEKTYNGVTTKYVLEGDKVVYETNSANSDKIHYTYSRKGSLISMNYNGAEYYYIKNAQGDIIGLYDDTGTQVVAYTYETYGKNLSVTGSAAATVGAKNPYRYRGYRLDTETGLYYLNSRYYNPNWGRFINADAIVTSNVFGYAENNPVNMVDPSGFYSEYGYEFEESPYYDRWLYRTDPAYYDSYITGNSDVELSKMTNSEIGELAKDVSYQEVIHKQLGGSELSINDKARVYVENYYLVMSASMVQVKGKAETVSSKYIDVTQPGSRYTNRATDVTRSQFEQNLLDNGWNRTISKDGKAVNFTLGGARYSIRDNARSTGGPTADFYKSGSTLINLKIRLGID